MTCQLPCVEGRPQQRRAVELVADQLGPLRGDDEEPDERVVGRDPGMPAKERLAEHGGPFDLEQEGHLAADVPDGIDLGEVVGRGLIAAEVGVLLAGFEQVAEQPVAVAPGLLAAADPDPHPEPVAGLGERRQQLGVLLAAAQQVVAGDDPLGRAGQAPIAVEAGPDEAVVGQVVAAEQRGDPVEERGLGHRSGGRQQAEDGPLDAVGERHGGGGEVVRVGQPPAAGLDLGQAALGRAAELVADEAEQALDRVGRIRRVDAGSALAARAPGRGARRRRRARLVGGGGSPTVVGRRVASAAASRHRPGAVRLARSRRERGGRRRSCRPGRARPGSRRAAARSGPARRGPGASRPRPRSRSARRRPRRTAGRRRARAARTGRAPGRRRDRRRRPAAARGRRWPASAAPGGSRPPGGSSSTIGGRVVVGIGQPRAEQPVARRSRRRAPPRRSPPAPPSTSWTTRPSRAIDGLDRARARRSIAAACQLHGGRSEAPASASIGRRRGRLATERPRRSRGRRPRGDPGSGASAAGRGRAGRAGVGAVRP